MTKRIFMSIMIVSMTIFFVSLFLVVEVLQDHYSSRLESRLYTEAEYLAQGVNNEGLEYLSGLNFGDTRVTLVNQDGSVVYDSRADVNAMDNHLDREEIIEAQTSGRGEAERLSLTLGTKTLYFALLLDDGSVLRISSSQYTFGALLVSMIQPIIFIIVAAALLAYVLAKRSAKKIVKPINEIDLEHPMGEDYYDEISPLLLKIASQNRIIHRQLEELDRKHREFNAIAENMSEGLLVVGANTQILSYNKSALKILGAQLPKEMKGFSVLALNRNENLARAMEMALAGEHNEQVLRLNGRCYNIMANPVYEGDELAGAVILLVDETEREERDHLRREFTANVSHELKTPLTSILGTSDMLRSGVVKAEDVSHFANNIYSETERLIQLVQDIIKLSQLEEADLPVEWETVDLGGLTETVLSRLDMEAQSKNVSLDYSGGVSWVRGVPQMLEEIVYNLVDNAIKYNHCGGQVYVTVSSTPDGRAVLTVSDTGQGIPAGYEDRVFERFYRVDRSHSRTDNGTGGTGLGLSIVKHSVAFHHGEINLESEEGKGTTITISFPAANDHD